MSWIALAIVLFIVVSIVFLLCMPVEIRVHFERVNSDDHGSFEMKTLFGLVRIHRELTEISTSFSSEGPTVHVQAKTENQSTPETSLSASDVLHLLKYMRTALAFGRKTLHILKRTGRHVHVREMNFEANVGLSDAVFTGIAVGLLYAAIEGVFGWLSHSLRFDNMPHVRIRPAYNQMRFHVKAESIMHVRFGYAISACIRLVMAWKRRT